MYGYSRDYYFILSQLWETAANTEHLPSVILLLGDYYQNTNDFNRAWSAYSDCVRRFPKSPEAEIASSRIMALRQHNPKRVDYAPTADKTTLYRHSEKVPTQNIESGIHYSVMIGPFRNIKQANSIKKLLDIDDFQQIFRTDNQFFICIGRVPTINAATNIKIRLAEEFEMMGEIVKIEYSENFFYIYEVDR